MRTPLLSLAVLSILAVSPAQVDPGFKSEKDAKAFEQAHKEFVQALERVMELRKKTDPTPAEKREIDFLRKRMLDLTRTTMSLLRPPPKEAPPLEPAPERPLEGWEKTLHAAAGLLIAADFERQGRRHFPEAASRVTCRTPVLLDHPSLGSMPQLRFYLAKFELEFPQPASKVHRFFHYRLAVLDLRTKTIFVHYPSGPTAPLRRLLDAGAVRAPTNEVAHRIQVAHAVLWHAGMGANVFVPKDRDGLSREELDQRFGLGTFADRIRPAPHEVVETGKERRLLTWHLHADDFGMPQQLVFAWERFAQADGTWLGRDGANGIVVPAETPLDDPKVKAAVAAFARDLQRR